MHLALVGPIYGPTCWTGHWGGLSSRKKRQRRELIEIPCCIVQLSPPTQDAIAAIASSHFASLVFLSKLGVETKRNSITKAGQGNVMTQQKRRLGGIRMCSTSWKTTGPYHRSKKVLPEPSTSLCIAPRAY